MIFSNNNVKSALSFFLGAALLVSCSENNKPAVRGTDSSTFYVNELKKVGFVAVGEPNQQGKYNTKLLSLEACMKDMAQTNSLSNLKFEVVAGDVVMEKQTDYNGCVQWQELIEFDPDYDDKDVIMNRSLAAKESHSGSYKFTFTVNPIKDEVSGLIRNGNFTETATASAVSFKLQQFVVSGAEQTSSDSNVIHVKIASRIENKFQSRISRQTEIETLGLESKGVDFHNLKIDQSLNLIFPYRYYTRFSVSLLKQRLDGIAGELIKKGDFKFYLVVLKENADITNPKVEDVLSGTEFSASPRGDAGLITVPIVLNFNNVTSITNRVNILFTAVSLDRPARFVDQNFEGFANGLVANVDLAVKLVPNSASAQQVYEAYVKQQTEVDKLKAPIAESLGKAGLELIGNPKVKYEIKDAPNSPARSVVVDFRDVIPHLSDSKGLSVAEKVAACAAYFQGKIASLADVEYQTCLSKPDSVIEASVSEIVENVDTDVSSAPAVMDTEVLNMTSTFEISSAKATGNGNNVTSEIAGKAKVKYGFPKLIEKISGWLTGLTPELEVSASVGGNAYLSHSKDNKQVDQTVARVGKVRSLTSLPIVISMNAKTAKCMVINKRVPAETSYSRYYCMPAQSVKKTEYYYLVDYNKADKTSVVIDQYSGIVNPFHMLVRGKGTYTSLKETLTNNGNITTFYIDKIDDKKLEDPSNYMTQEAPLVLSSRRNLISK